MHSLTPSIYILFILSISKLQKLKKTEVLLQRRAACRRRRYRIAS